MSDDLTLYVPAVTVSDFVVVLSGLDGVSVQIVRDNVPTPSPSRIHPDYNLPPPDLVAVVISGIGLATSIAALATALLKLLTDQKEAARKSRSASPPPISISVNQHVTVVSDAISSKDLAIAIGQALGARPDSADSRDESPERAGK